ncbi:MAG: hypothetical protein AUJ34_00830 [Parcubacteria group bacterium CG1_02_41_12]|nr:MAG: hypothetical protein AUJ34_00830 [Parcubacteria group bacterium CG1_02_41_12]PIQ80174.1 MAG: isoleucine--tRNA ligase [Parcubacteria group bacterium CG11_big_fil_rev_8_21_14_0_20_41_14]
MKQSEIEHKVLEFWNKDKTFQKSIKKHAPKGDYAFYDGPPFATGTPHYGHIVASLMKDIVPRYFTMRGFRVERRWGWDCHGLPIENIVEKEKGFKHKKDIEKYGIDNFNEDARSKVLKYATEWKTVIERMGRWVDFDNDYKTMDPDFMESIWSVFKELYDKDLLYESYRCLHICPRCETTLAQSEVAQGYMDVKDLSVTVKFELEDDLNRHPLGILRAGSERSVLTESKDLIKDAPVYLLAWTTTPWTLPGNMAATISEKIKYVKVTFENAKYIVAKERLQEVFKDKEYSNEQEVKPKDLIGKKYKPLFPYYNNDKLENRENAFKVYAGNDFVNTEEGTGIVHIAPAFGADDYGLSKQEQIPFIQHVNLDGTFKKEVADFKGLEVKPKDDPTKTDVEIIKYLAKHNLLFAKQKIEHSYPHCWRCDSPLLNYSTSSWFVAVEKIKKDLLKNAKHINWQPSHIKDGRFGQWLEGARDWSISRQRFWGSVMPIWVCDKNKEHKKVIGSIKELQDLSGKKVKDLHKHFVDKITFKCEECDGTMKRIPDVLDCWFESGSMPFAAEHYPFENEKKFKENFPAEFIAEGVDQTRAWFYYMHVLSVALKKSHAFKNVIVNGIVLAEDGKKMSKRLQNYPDPMEMFEKYGADAVRYYLATSTVMRAEDLNFSERGVDEVVKKVLLTLYNVLAFYKMYAETKSKIQNPNDKEIPKSKFQNSKHILDKWIIAKTNELISEVTDAYDNYDLNRATRPIMDFIQELSTWYVRRSRDRFKSDDEKDKQSALSTLRWVLEQTALVLAPVMPFTAEHVWQELHSNRHSEGVFSPEESRELRSSGQRRDSSTSLQNYEVDQSVHLQDWPKAEKVDKEVLSNMEKARYIVELALSKRALYDIKIRQPLLKLTVFCNSLDKEYNRLISDEVNVKNVEFSDKGVIMDVELDKEITYELRLEGHLRELTRSINSLRKKQGLTTGDIIVLIYDTKSKELKKVFEMYVDELKKSIIAKEIVEKKNDGELIGINGEKITLQISILS